jgi:hypothetical protein
MKNNFLDPLWRFFSRKQRPYRYLLVEELPDPLEAKTVYLQNHQKIPWQATFKCPCGCGDTIMLNLTTGYRPRWQFKPDKKTLTISPSIRRTEGCKSHFFLRRGKVEWCED